jgi:MoaA/NifB/PqqE/SkfB family radical SAM enzyme
MSIKAKLATTKIKKMQLDPFGYCNAKCWFCPVKYFPQPEEGNRNISLDLVEKIFADITKEKNSLNGIVDRNFNLVTLSHYNEMLLFKDFDKLLDLMRKYQFQTYVLSNGISLSKQKVDLIKEYPDVVTHVGLNIPAFERELWAKRSGFSPDQFDRLISNLTYAGEQLAYLKNELSIGINGFDTNPVNAGYISLGKDFASLDYDINPNTGEHETQFQLARKMFPMFNVHKDALYDRVGSISNLISNQPHMQRQLNMNRKVVGCTNWGDRTTEWLNVNSAGNVFLCCNDYNFEYKFGDFNTQSLREIWLSDLHAEVVEKAYGNICTKCFTAKFV